MKMLLWDWNENDATLTFNNSQGDVDKKDTPEEKPKVVTGGKTFIKVDKNKTDTKLRDAVFQLFDGEDAVTWTADLIAANKEAIEAGKFATKSGDSYTETSAIVDLTPEEPIYLRSAGTEETPDGTLKLKVWNSHPGRNKNGIRPEETMEQVRWKIMEIQ